MKWTDAKLDRMIKGIVATLAAHHTQITAQSTAVVELGTFMMANLPQRHHGEIRRILDGVGNAAAQAGKMVTAWREEEA